MRRKRVIESSIGMDDDIAKLTDFEVRVYMFGLGHTDNFGRFIGEPEKFKRLVDPYSSHTIEEYEAALQKISETGNPPLITRYGQPGKRFIQYKKTSFDRINHFFIKRRGMPEFPGPDETEQFSIDSFMLDHWGEVWKKLPYIYQQKVVELHRVHGTEKFSKAVEYSAERDARNLLYIKAILEGKAKEADKKGWLTKIRNME